MKMKNFLYTVVVIFFIDGLFCYFTDDSSTGKKIVPCFDNYGHEIKNIECIEEFSNWNLKAIIGISSLISACGSLFILVIIYEEEL